MSKQDILLRDNVLKCIETALNNATGDLYDVYSAIRALPAVTPAVKVKPLVWTQVASSVYDAPAGGYRIFHHGPDGAVGPCNIYGPDGFFALRSNLEAAKAAAQADYEAHILSAVDVTPAPTLAEALDVLPLEGERANVQRVEHCWPEKCWIVRWGPFASEKQAEAMLCALRRIAEGQA